MEQRDKVRLTTFNTFDLESDEQRRLYIYLSLFQYRYLRVPNYHEHLLIDQLTKDFKRFYTEMQAQTERDPNNHNLHRIKAFFDMHYKKLKEIAEEERGER